MKTKQIIVISIIAAIATIVIPLSYYELTKSTPVDVDLPIAQSLTNCPEGTSFVKLTDDGKIKCEGDPTPPLSDSVMLGIGIAIAAFATGLGLILTWKDRKDAAKQRNQEIVQLYSEELREISNQELNLKTKQECALYAEQYLDTMEKIATLLYQDVFDEDTMSYFDNNFAYAMDLWWWYNLNLHGIKDEIQDEIWKITRKSKLKEIFTTEEYKNILEINGVKILKNLWLDMNKTKNDKLENIEGMKELDEHRQKILQTLWKDSTYKSLKKIFTNNELKLISKDDKKKLKVTINNFDKFLACRNYISQDRWPDFRKWCSAKSITDFDYNFRGIGGMDNSRDNWRVLPEVMYYQYAELPDENGLSKAEFVEIIRPFANDLSKFVEQEKVMCKPEQFEVYAEQYLETLEQIATLYENKIIPTKASEYFENKFAYGCNLWNWYHDVVLKFSPNFYHSLWNMKNAIEIKELIKNGKSKSQLENEIFTKFSKDYLQKTKSTSNDILNIFKKENPDVWKLVAKTSVIDQTTSDTDILKSLKDFVIRFATSERWQDFRWWCQTNKITSFEEDRSEGLILPLKMWQAEYK